MSGFKQFYLYVSTNGDTARKKFLEAVQTSKIDDIVADVSHTTPRDVVPGNFKITLHSADKAEDLYRQLAGRELIQSVPPTQVKSQIVEINGRPGNNGSRPKFGPESRSALSLA